MALGLCAFSAAARMPEAKDVAVRDVKAVRDGSRLNLDFTIDCGHMPSKSYISTRLQPMIKCGSDSLLLNSVTVAGRTRYLQAKREGELVTNDNRTVRAGKEKVIDYQTSVAWQPWMENADIELIVENLGCCQSRKTIAERGLARLNMGDRTFDAPLEYITPVEERVKTRQARGEAYIDFRVNKTDILPDYRNNPVELRKIRATIDSVKNDTDTKITTLRICGYASPEGSYANNERLAQGRTNALADYVKSLYSFPSNLMQTSWVAEDWAGLRRYVSESQMSAKDRMLEIIDGPLSPDEKDRKLKADFPVDYAYMLENWYPALRHSDYAVEYTVRSYSDPAEIARVMKKQPSKLSLREFFILAETLDPKSQEYADVFDTAVRMYPDDAVANLNAANTAISRGELTRAATYLKKAGNTAQAEYARGVLAARTGDYKEAAARFAEAKRGGINTAKALEALEKLQAPEVITFD